MEFGFNVYDVYEGSEPYIFVSYAHKDAHIVLPIIHNMQEQGLRVWFDEGIELGAEWPEYIAEHLIACSCFLAFVSQNSLDSINCRQEINLAISRNKNPVAIYLEEVALTPGMELRLGSIKAMYYHRFTSSEQFIQKLCSAKLLQNCKAPIGIYPARPLVKNCSEITRETVRSITFLNHSEVRPPIHWDVSKDWGSKTYCWAYKNNNLHDVFLAADGGVIAPADCSCLFKDCTNLIQIGFSGMNPSNINNTHAMFSGCTALERIDISKWNMSEVTDISDMFRNCTNLSKLDVSQWDTSGVTTMCNTFRSCTALTELELSHWNTSKVTNMSGMFRSCSKLTKLDLDHFNTSNVTAMYAMFYDCTELQSIKLNHWNTSKVTDMRHLFDQCASLHELDLSNFDTAQVTTMYAMFHKCKMLSKLDVSGFNTSNVTDMSWMFGRCTGLTELDVSRFNTTQTTACSSMFMNCSSLSELNVRGFDTGKVTDLSWMFKGCSKLSAPDISGWDLSAVTKYERFLDEDVLINGAPWKALFTQTS